MPNLHEMKFKRKFSVNLFKNRKLKLSEMSFFKDFIGDTRGDPYPLLSVGDDCREHVAGGHYFAEGKVVRLMGAYFPYATYEMKLEALDGACGFGFRSPLGNVEVLIKTDGAGKLSLVFDEEETPTDRPFRAGMSLVVTARKNNFEVYFNYGDMPELVADLIAPKLDGIHFEKVFSVSHTSLVCDGKVELSHVSSYMDSGISQADIRPVKYENGDIIYEGGKMYFTLTARMQAEMYQAVFSWVPGTCEWELCGAIFFDAGDGAWCSDVATSLKFNRGTGKWNLWVCSFSHDHVLGYAEFDGDVRFGVNVVDITLLPHVADTEDRRRMVGFWGDEDPDFIFDEASGKWYFTVCRLVYCGEKRHYAYHLFEADSPFTGFRFHGATENGGAETGGSLVRVGDTLHFVCGNAFDRRANYRVYDVPNLTDYTDMQFDYDDGGFRGWGTIVPLKMGTRTRYFHLTFDRHNGSDYNWSYGDLYCFEA